MHGSKRGWGPFTGGQLTVMVCVVAVVVLFPVGAWALSFSNVAITDPGGVNQAKVDATGKLAVGDGTGPLSVDGMVNARPALPTKPIVIISQGAQDAGTTLYGPASKPFGLGSLTLDNGCDTSAYFHLSSVTSPGGSVIIEYVVLDPHQTFQLGYPIPLVTSPPPGGTVLLQGSSGGGCVTVSGVGYQS
jgi:hypothetical protein